MDAGGAKTELTALAILPDRTLADQFLATLPATRTFHILAELRSYPPVQTLDVRLRQLQPHLVFIDLASDLDKATELIEFIASVKPPIYVVGLHVKNDPEAILRALRAGSGEYLYAPFDIDIQKEAIARITKSLRPQSRSEGTRGRLITFSSTKPGSGSSTLASQTAFALKNTTGKRVLLADFDLWSGTVGFFFKLNHWYSLIDAIQQFGRTEDNSDWASLVVNSDGVDILPAPDVPRTLNVEIERLHDLLEFTRTIYDWIVIDLPSAFEKLSLMTLSASDDAFLVCTPELPSLHLTRKAVAYLSSIGFGQERYRVLVNRLGRQDGISIEDMTRIFGAPVHRTFPNDYMSLHKGLTVGQPLGSKSPLGRSIGEFISSLTGQDAGKSKKTGT